MLIACLCTMISALLYSSTNFIDKFLVNDMNESSGNVKTLLIFSSLIAGIVFSPIWLIISGFDISISLIPLICVLLSSVVNIMAIYFYFKALEVGDTSTVVVMFQLIPVFTYILGLIFFQEALTTKELLGSIIIILSSIFISIDFKNHNKSSFKVLSFMTISSLLYAIYYILFDVGIRNASFNACAFYEQIGLLVIGIIFMFIGSFRTMFIKSIKTNGKKYFSLNCINEFLNIVAGILENYANVLIPIALVNVIGRVQVIFVFVIGLIGTIFLPKLFSEKIDKNTLIQKISCIVLSIVGFIIMFI